MELINGIQIEVTQIQIKKNQLLGKRSIFKFKRLIFVSSILSIKQDNYMVNQNYADCTTLILNTNEWVKVIEPYEDINPIYVKWWKEASENGTEPIEPTTE
jgi:hypothetical protein